MSNPFDFLDSVLASGKDIWSDTRNDYNKYLLVRGCSLHLDSILAAYNANLLNSVPDMLHYKYLLNTCVKMPRRLAKWPKADEDHDLELIQLYYGFNKQKATEALQILTKKDIERIRTRYERQVRRPNRSEIEDSRQLQDNNGDTD